VLAGGLDATVETKCETVPVGRVKNLLKFVGLLKAASE